MQTRSCVRGVVLVAALAVGSHAGAQCTKYPVGSGACTGKLNLSITISKSGNKGSLSMTHCPFPPGLSGLTAPPLMLTITPGFALQFTNQVRSGKPPCQGKDEYLATSGERLKYVLGAGESVVATHLKGLPLPGSGVTVTITDSNNHTVGGTLTCTATKSRIRCQ